MFSDGELAALAAMSESAMRDTCVITTRAESSTGGEPTVTSATLYSGKCRVTTPGGPRVVVAGERAQAQINQVLHLPRTAAAVPAGAQVTVTEAGGAVTVYRADGELAHTTRASRRVQVTRVG